MRFGVLVLLCCLPLVAIGWATDGVRVAAGFSRADTPYALAIVLGAFGCGLRLAGGRLRRRFARRTGNDLPWHEWLLVNRFRAMALPGTVTFAVFAADLLGRGDGLLEAFGFSAASGLLAAWLASTVRPRRGAGPRSKDRRRRSRRLAVYVLAYIACVVGIEEAVEGIRVATGVDLAWLGGLVFAGVNGLLVVRAVTWWRQRGVRRRVPDGS